jgi:bifunctional non-homologous end joining protein LigD
MSRKPVSRSRRQYTKGLNNPALWIGSERKEAKGAPLPSFIEPCLAEARPLPPSNEQWVHEIKLDGYRLQLRINNGKVNCYTRRGYDWATRFPTLVSAAQKLNIEAAIIDGEVVVVAENGDTDFAALESYVASKSPERSARNLVFYAFDLLYISPLDIRNVPLLVRKEALRALLPAKDSPLKFNDHIKEDGRTVLRQACAMELEGIVSKRKDAPYRSGRNANWTKVTCRHRETFVIAGLAFRGSKFDGVYLGRREGKTLVYAGKVETGFSEEQVKRLQDRTRGLKSKRQPIEADRTLPKAEWLEPVLLGDVEYRRKTTAGLLRHPSYKGLREDL